MRRKSVWYLNSTASVKKEKQLSEGKTDLLKEQDMGTLSSAVLDTCMSTCHKLELSESTETQLRKFIH